MAANWLSIRVELVSGNGRTFSPRPGRDFVVSSAHRFAHLADAIDLAFARWDTAHLHEFHMPDGRSIGPIDEDADFDLIDETTVSLATLEHGEQFAYEFDFGDCWLHLCTVGPDPVDPVEVYGVRPSLPVPYWGWGDMPDQYGRMSPDGPDPADEELPRGFPWRSKVDG